MGASSRRQNDMEPLRTTPFETIAKTDKTNTLLFTRALVEAKWL